MSSAPSEPVPSTPIACRHHAVAGDEVDDFAVSGAHGQKIPVSDGLAVFIDDGHVMRVGMGIDPSDDTGFGSQNRSCSTFSG